MTTRTSPPFRADHVGSLLRPPELLLARREHAEGTRDAAQLTEAEDAAVRQVVSLQEGIGLRSATDGEFRRTSWHMDFIYQLGGIERSSDQLVVSFKDSQGATSFTSAALEVRGKVHLEETIFADAFRVLDAATTTAVPKLTIPSPSMVHYRSGRAAVDRTVYPDIEEFW
ncbi:MAG: 5-methyltetrahydropteroyltriglutamate--homocysteine S-methyltransferase, partial [Acidimicrobiales bacterium]